MARAYRLDHFTKGTGASVAPIDEHAEKPEEGKLNTVRLPAEPRRPRKRGEQSSGPLPPGHVRKKTTGEIGRVESVDPRAGNATVFWLKQGRTSVVPLTTVSRR